MNDFTYMDGKKNLIIYPSKSDANNYYSLLITKIFIKKILKYINKKKKNLILISSSLIKPFKDKSSKYTDYIQKFHFYYLFFVITGVKRGRQKLRE